MTNLKEEIEKIDFDCDMHFCFGHRKARKQLFTIFSELIDDIFSRLPSKLDPITREEIFDVIEEQKKKFIQKGVG